MRTLVCEGLRGFYSSIRLTFVSWLRRSFPVGDIFFASLILRDPFLIGLSWLKLNVGHKIFPHMPMRGGQVKPHQLRQGFAYPLQLPSVNFISCPYILVILFRCFVVRKVQSSTFKWNYRLYPIIVRS